MIPAWTAVTEKVVRFSVCPLKVKCKGPAEGRDAKRKVEALGGAQDLGPSEQGRLSRAGHRREHKRPAVPVVTVTGTARPDVAAPGTLPPRVTEHQLSAGVRDTQHSWLLGARRSEFRPAPTLTAWRRHLPRCLCCASKLHPSALAAAGLSSTPTVWSGPGCPVSEMAQCAAL